MNTKLKFMVRSVILFLMLLAGNLSGFAKIVSDGSTRLYYNIKGETWWIMKISEDYDGNHVYFYNSVSDQNAWANGSTLVEGDVVYVTVPEGEWDRCILVRGKSTTGSFDNFWNKTGDITIPDGKNYIKNFSEDSATTEWDNYGYSITYNLNGGTNPAGAPTTYDGTSDITLPKPTKDGYEFGGWYTKEDMSSSVVSKISTGSTGDKTYWAKWTADDTEWRIVGSTINDSWEKPVTNGVALTKAYDNVYFYHYDGSTTAYFRVACGTQQYHTNNVGVTVGGSRINLVERPKGEGDQISIQVPGACYICVDTETKEVWLQSSVPDKTWRVVGAGSWENPTAGYVMTNAYGNVYYYQYTGSDQTYIRIAEGMQQYHTNGTALSIANGNKVDMTARISGQGDQTSITIPEACYICVNATTKQVWLQSSVPTHEIYFDAAVLNWMTDGATFQINWYSDADTQIGETVKMTKVDGYSATYKATAPDNATMMQVLRYDSEEEYNWNETSITAIDENHDFYYATGWSSGDKDQGTFKSYPLGAKDSGAIDITLNIYWNMTATSTGNFNSWIYGGEHWTQYTKDSSAGWYVDPDSSNPDNRPYSTTEQIKGTDWYKVTLYFTGVNATNEVARLGVGSASNKATDNYITMEDIVLSSYKTPGTYNVYYYNGNIVADPDVNEYYLIVKNADESKTKSYKMDDARFRVLGIVDKYKNEAGLLSKRYFTKTVKSEWLFDGTNYCYIANDAAGMQAFARPSGGNVDLTFSDSDLYGVSGYKKQSENTTDAGNNYFVLDNTKSFKSYVFDIAVKEEYHPLDVYANGSIDITYNSQKQDSYYVIGNFGNTVSASEQMKPYEDKYTKLMNKYYYKNGLASADVIADADSIVYKLEVNRPDNGWGELYLMFAPADVINQWKSDKADSHWRQTIRPQVNYDAVDATALEGGLIYTNDHFEESKPKDMSINPLLSEAQKYRYVAYTVYLNVTTSTYRIEFHDEYYLAGPAVSAGYNDRIKLEIVTDEGSRSHYKYTGTFTNGSKFLVYSNHESLGFYFHEDNDGIGTTGVSSVDDVVAPSTKEQDFDFFNHMKYEQGIGRTEADDDNAFTFNLPTGEYTIRFYDLAEDVNGHSFYTIDKVTTLKNATSTFVDADGNNQTENRGGWVTYSDDVATYIPQGVKAYYVDQAGNGMVHLKELKKIIPAHCGVLLHDPSLQSGSKSFNLIPVVEGNIFATSLSDVEGGTPENYLVDCYQFFGNDHKPTSEKVSVGAETEIEEQKYYNYFFTNKITAKLKGGTTTKQLSVPLNFWRANGSASRKKTYLQVKDEVKPAWYNNGTFAIDEASAISESKSYCFVMSFIDIENNEDAPVVTNISTVNTQDDSDAYYNIQGMRVARPITSGLYIKNGKKIYVK